MFKQNKKYFLKFIHQFYQFENEYLPEYFQKCVHLYFRGKVRFQAKIQVQKSHITGLGVCSAKSRWYIAIHGNIC